VRAKEAENARLKKQLAERQGTRQAHPAETTDSGALESLNETREDQVVDSVLTEETIQRLYADAGRRVEAAKRTEEVI
jgi:hypothetical protein